MPDIFDRVSEKQEKPTQEADIFSRVAAKRPAVESPKPGPTESAYRNLRTGRVTVAPTDTRIPIIDAPITGVPEIISGVKRMAKPAAALMTDIGNIPAPATGVTPKPMPKPSLTPELAKQGAAGLHQAVGGAFETLTPVMAAAGVAAPVETAVTLGATMGAQVGVEKGLKELGMPEEYAAVAGDLVGLIAGAKAHGWTEPIKEQIRTKLRDRLKAKRAEEVKPAPPEAKPETKPVQAKPNEPSPAVAKQPTTSVAVKRERGEKYGDYQKRKAAAEEPSGQAAPPKEIEVPKEAEKSSEATPAEAHPQEAQPPGPKPPEKLPAVLEPDAKLIGEQRSVQSEAPKEEVASLQDQARAKSTPRIFTDPLTDTEKAKADSKPLEEIQRTYVEMSQFKPPAGSEAGAFEDRLSYYRDLIERKKDEGKVAQKPQDAEPVTLIAEQLEPPKQPEQKPMEVKQEAPQQTVSPDAAKPPATEANEKPVAPPSKPATPGVESAVQRINTTMQKQNIESVRIQPLDSSGKPVGKPIEMKSGSSPEEIQRTADQVSNSGHGGMVMAEPIGGQTAGLKKWMVRMDEPKEGAKSARARERGGASMDFLTGGLASKFEGDPNAPKANYSGMGAIKDLGVRNLSQLEEASPKSHEAAVRGATSKAQAAAILGTSVPRIKYALKAGEGPSWDRFREVLIESRLIGARDRWIDFSQKATEFSDEDLEKNYKTWIADLLKNVQSKKGLPQDLSETAATLIQQKDYPLLRQFLHETFLDAADAVSSIVPEAEYDAAVRNKGFKDALAIYKTNVEQPVAESHSLNEGVFSNALGPLDTYYPLTPLVEGEAQVQQGPGRRLPFHKPKNLSNRFTTGLAEGYDPSMQIFRDRLSASIRANNKASLIQTLRDEGLAYKQEPGDPGDTFNLHGVEYRGVRLETTPQRLIIRDGNVVHVPAQFDIVPEWLEKELRPILAKDHMDDNAVKQIMGAVNNFSLAGPLDFVFHTSNLMGTLVSNTPFLGTSLGDKAASLPFAKRFAAAMKVLWTDPTTEEATKDILDMSKLGLIPERYGTVTRDPVFAEEMGAEEKKYSFAPALFGQKGVDVKARLVMYRLAKEINPEATPMQLYHFVNQLGNYTSSLQGQIERSVKATGFSPFYTAGSTMLRNGINAWTGMSPMPSDAASLRAWQQMTGGAIGAVATWMMAYQQMTGSWPEEDSKAKLMQIPVSDEWRHSAAGEALWGKGQDIGYVNLNFFNPIVGRGASALGIRGAFDTAVVGGSARQIKNAAVADILNSALHPFLGPSARAAFVGLSGAIGQPREAYIYPGPSVATAGPKNATATQKSVATITQLNPGAGGAIGYGLGKLSEFYPNVAEYTGFGQQDETLLPNRWLLMSMNMAFPNLVTRGTDPYKKQQALQREEKEATKPVVVQ